MGAYDIKIEYGIAVCVLPNGEKCHWGDLGGWGGAHGYGPGEGGAPPAGDTGGGGYGYGVVGGVWAPTAPAAPAAPAAPPPETPPPSSKIGGEESPPPPSPQYTGPLTSEEVQEGYDAGKEQTGDIGGRWNYEAATFNPEGVPLPGGGKTTGYEVTGGPARLTGGYLTAGVPASEIEQREELSKQRAEKMAKQIALLPEVPLDESPSVPPIYKTGGEPEMPSKPHVNFEDLTPEQQHEIYTLTYHLKGHVLTPENVDEVTNSVWTSQGSLVNENGETLASTPYGNDVVVSARGEVVDVKGAGQEGKSVAEISAINQPLTQTLMVNAMNEVASGKAESIVEALVEKGYESAATQAKGQALVNEYLAQKNEEEEIQRIYDNIKSIYPNLTKSQIEARAREAYQAEIEGHDKTDFRESILWDRSNKIDFNNNFNQAKVDLENRTPEEYAAYFKDGKFVNEVTGYVTQAGKEAGYSGKVFNAPIGDFVQYAGTPAMVLYRPNGVIHVMHRDPTNYFGTLEVVTSGVPGSGATRVGSAGGGGGFDRSMSWGRFIKENPGLGYTATKVAVAPEFTALSELSAKAGVLTEDFIKRIDSLLDSGNITKEEAKYYKGMTGRLDGYKGEKYHFENGKIVAVTLPSGKKLTVAELQQLYPDANMPDSPVEAASRIFGVEDTTVQAIEDMAQAYENYFSPMINDAYVADAMYGADRANNPKPTEWQSYLILAHESHIGNDGKVNWLGLGEFAKGTMQNIESGRSKKIEGMPVDATSTILDLKVEPKVVAPEAPPTAEEKPKAEKEKPISFEWPTQVAEGAEAEKEIKKGIDLSIAGEVRGASPIESLTHGAGEKEQEIGGKTVPTINVVFNPPVEQIDKSVESGRPVIVVRAVYNCKHCGEEIRELNDVALAMPYADIYVVTGQEDNWGTPEHAELSKYYKTKDSTFGVSYYVDGERQDKWSNQMDAIREAKRYVPSGVPTAEEMPSEGVKTEEPPPEKAETEEPAPKAEELETEDRYGISDETIDIVYPSIFNPETEKIKYVSPDGMFYGFEYDGFRVSVHYDENSKTWNACTDGGCVANNASLNVLLSDMRSGKYNTGLQEMSRKDESDFQSYGTYADEYNIHPVNVVSDTETVKGDVINPFTPTISAAEAETHGISGDTIDVSYPKQLDPSSDNLLFASPDGSFYAFKYKGGRVALYKEGLQWVLGVEGEKVASSLASIGGGIPSSLIKGLREGKHDDVIRFRDADKSDMQIYSAYTDNYNIHPVNVVAQEAVTPPSAKEITTTETQHKEIPKKESAILPELSSYGTEEEGYRLGEYIVDSFNNGVTKNAIKNILHDAKFSDETIDKAITSYLPSGNYVSDAEYLRLMKPQNVLEAREYRENNPNDLRVKYSAYSWDAAKQMDEIWKSDSNVATKVDNWLQLGISELSKQFKSVLGDVYKPYVEGVPKADISIEDISKVPVNPHNPIMVGLLNYDARKNAVQALDTANQTVTEFWTEEDLAKFIDEKYQRDFENAKKMGLSEDDASVLSYKAKAITEFATSLAHTVFDMGKFITVNQPLILSSVVTQLADDPTEATTKLADLGFGMVAFPTVFATSTASKVAEGKVAQAAGNVAGLGVTFVATPTTAIKYAGRLKTKVSYPISKAMSPGTGSYTLNIPMSTVESSIGPKGLSVLQTGEKILLEDAPRGKQVLFDANGKVIMEVTPLQQSGITDQFFVFNRIDEVMDYIHKNPNLPVDVAEIASRGTPFPGQGFYASPNMSIRLAAGIEPAGNQLGIIGKRITEYQQVPKDMQNVYNRLSGEKDPNNPLAPVVDSKRTPFDVVEDIVNEVVDMYTEKEAKGELAEGHYPVWKTWWKPDLQKIVELVKDKPGLTDSAKRIIDKIKDNQKQVEWEETWQLYNLLDDSEKKKVKTWMLELETYSTKGALLYPTIPNPLTTIKELGNKSGGSYIKASEDIYGSDGKLMAKKGSDIPIVWMADKPNMPSPSVKQLMAAEYIYEPASMINRLLNAPVKTKLGYGGIEVGELSGLSVKPRKNIDEYLDINRRSTVIIRNPQDKSQILVGKQYSTEKLVPILRKEKGFTGSSSEILEQFKSLTEKEQQYYKNRAAEIHFDTIGGTPFTLGESPLETAVRESIDEAGVYATGGRYIGYVFGRHMKDKIKGEFVQEPRVFDLYEMDYVGKLKPSSEILELAWYDGKDLYDMSGTRIRGSVSDITPELYKKVIDTKTSVRFDVTEPKRLAGKEKMGAYKREYVQGEERDVIKARGEEAVVVLQDKTGQYYEPVRVNRSSGQTMAEAIRVVLENRGVNPESYSYVQFWLDFPQGIYSEIHPGMFTDLYVAKIGNPSGINKLSILDDRLMDALNAKSGILRFKPFVETMTESSNYVRANLSNMSKGDIKKIQDNMNKVAQKENWKIEWLSPDDLHLTIKYIGKMPEQAAIEFTNAIKKFKDDISISKNPLVVDFKDIQGWPNVKDTQFITLRVKSFKGMHELTSLQKAIDAIATRYDIPSDSYRFEPHITIGKVTSSNINDRMKVGAYVAKNPFTNTVRAKFNDIELKASKGEKTKDIETSFGESLSTKDVKIPEQVSQIEKPEWIADTMAEGNNILSSLIKKDTDLGKIESEYNSGRLTTNEYYESLANVVNAKYSNKIGIHAYYSGGVWEYAVLPILNREQYRVIWEYQHSKAKERAKEYDFSGDVLIKEVDSIINKRPDWIKEAVDNGQQAFRAIEKNDHRIRQLSKLWEDGNITRLEYWDKVAEILDKEYKDYRLYKLGEGVYSRYEYLPEMPNTQKKTILDYLSNEHLQVDSVLGVPEHIRKMDEVVKDALDGKFISDERVDMWVKNNLEKNLHNKEGRRVFKEAIAETRYENIYKERPQWLKEMSAKGSYEFEKMYNENLEYRKIHDELNSGKIAWEDYKKARDGIIKEGYPELQMMEVTNRIDAPFKKPKTPEELAEYDRAKQYLIKEERKIDEIFSTLDISQESQKVLRSKYEAEKKYKTASKYKDSRPTVIQIGILPYVKYKHIGDKVTETVYSITESTPPVPSSTKTTTEYIPTGLDYVVKPDVVDYPTITVAKTVIPPYKEPVPPYKEPAPPYKETQQYPEKGEYKETPLYPGTPVPTEGRYPAGGVAAVTPVTKKEGIVIIHTKKGDVKLTNDQFQHAIAWKQGKLHGNKPLYKFWYPNYGQDDIINTLEPIQDVPYKEGVKSAYESAVVLFGGIIPPHVTRTMGVMKVDVFRGTNKMKPVMKFTERPKDGKGKKSKRSKSSKQSLSSMQ